MGFVENYYCRQLTGISGISQFATTGTVSQESLSSKHIVQLLVHQGPNGQHQCLVFELLGPTVASVLASRHLETNVILRMSKQLLETIRFIHD